MSRRLMFVAAISVISAVVLGLVAIQWLAPLFGTFVCIVTFSGVLIDEATHLVKERSPKQIFSIVVAMALGAEIMYMVWLLSPSVEESELENCKTQISSCRAAFEVAEQALFEKRHAATNK